MKALVGTRYRERSKHETSVWNNDVHGGNLDWFLLSLPLLQLMDICAEPLRTSWGWEGHNTTTYAMLGLHQHFLTAHLSGERLESGSRRQARSSSLFPLHISFKRDLPFILFLGGGGRFDVLGWIKNDRPT